MEPSQNTVLERTDFGQREARRGRFWGLCVRAAPVSPTRGRSTPR
jgi:hypothetical protein